MPKRMMTSKYFKALLILNRWVYFYPDLTSTEAERMFDQSDFKDVEIPSRPRISQMIKGLKEVPIRRPLSVRKAKEEAKAKRIELLYLLAKDTVEREKNNKLMSD